MTARLKPATSADVAAIERALKDVRSARANLRKAGATKAANRVASVVHSVEGALRHAYRRAYAERDHARCGERIPLDPTDAQFGMPPLK